MQSSPRSETAPPPVLEITGRRAWAPMTLGVAWMLGTLVCFLWFGNTEELSLVLLVVFAVCATAAWALGYAWGVRAFPLARLQERFGGEENQARHARAAAKWVLASGVYYALYGYSLLVLYGATSATFWEVVKNPGSAYAAKFATIDSLSAETGHPLLQLLILCSVFQLALAPLLTFFWGSLPLSIRAVGMLGMASYVAFFLYIGTMQGLGFLLVGLMSGLIAKRWRPGATKRQASRYRRWITLALVLFISAFSVYMINAQADRLDTFSVTDRFEPNEHVEEIFGREFARGLAVFLEYPTHGYRGLALNLDAPFEWTGLRGSSRAVDSYWQQFFGESVFEKTYPARTERATGWSATIVWSTVYPWLASDFTYPGTIILMLLIGRWTASMWFRSTIFHDPLALMLFSQLMLFVLFVPVNNQVLISQPAFNAVVQCVLLFWFRDLFRRRPKDPDEDPEEDPEAHRVEPPVWAAARSMHPAVGPAVGRP